MPLKVLQEIDPSVLEVDISGKSRSVYSVTETNSESLASQRKDFSGSIWCRAGGVRVGALVSGNPVLGRKAALPGCSFLCLGPNGA